MRIIIEKSNSRYDESTSFDKETIHESNSNSSSDSSTSSDEEASYGLSTNSYTVAMIQSSNNIIAAIAEFGLSRDEAQQHNNWSDRQDSLNNYQATLEFLRSKKAIGVKAKEALIQISGLSSQQISAVAEFGLSKDEVQQHDNWSDDWDSLDNYQATIKFLRSKKANVLSVKTALNQVSGLSNAAITAMAEFGLSRDDVRQHNNWGGHRSSLNNCHATLEFLRNKNVMRRDQANEALSQISGLSSHQITAVAKVGLSKKQVEAHDNWNDRRGSLNNYQATLKFLTSKKVVGGHANDALSQISGLSSRQIAAVEEFGLSKDEVEEHDNWGDKKGSPENYQATLDYLRSKKVVGDHADEALREISGLSSRQITAMNEFGLSKKQVEAHNNWRKDGYNDTANYYATLDYLRNKNVVGDHANDALGQISGLSGHKITAMTEFGLSREQVEAHDNWRRRSCNGTRIGNYSATLDYLRSKHVVCDQANEALREISGLSSNKICAMREFSLSRNEVAGHDNWRDDKGSPENYQATLKFLRSKKIVGDQANEALSQISGLSSQQIAAVDEFGLSKTQVEEHDNWGDKKGSPENYQATLEFLRSKKAADVNASDALDQISGLSSEQIAAVTEFGLSKKQVVAHDNWRKDGYNDTANYYATLDYLRNKNVVGDHANDALGQISGLSGNKITAMTEFGLSREQVEAHDNWRENWDSLQNYNATINFLRSKKVTGVYALNEALNKISGLSSNQITAVAEFSLSKDEVQDQRGTWRDNGIFKATLKYLRRKINDGVSARDALTQICGLSADQISAVTEFDLSREQVQAQSNWNSREDRQATLKFLRNKPKGFKDRNTFDIIKGKNSVEIKEIQMQITAYKKKYADQCAPTCLSLSKHSFLNSIHSTINRRICEFAFFQSPHEFPKTTTLSVLHRKLIDDGFSLHSQEENNGRNILYKIYPTKNARDAKFTQLSKDKCDVKKARVEKIENDRYLTQPALVCELNMNTLTDVPTPSVSALHF